MQDCVKFDLQVAIPTLLRVVMPTSDGSPWLVRAKKDRTLLKLLFESPSGPNNRRPEAEIANTFLGQAIALIEDIIEEPVGRGKSFPSLDANKPQTWLLRFVEFIMKGQVTFENEGEMETFQKWPKIVKVCTKDLKDAVKKPNKEDKDKIKVKDKDKDEGGEVLQVPTSIGGRAMDEAMKATWVAMVNMSECLFCIRASRYCHPGPEKSRIRCL